MASNNNIQNQNASGSFEIVGFISSTQSPSNRQINMVGHDATWFDVDAPNGGNHNGVFQSPQNLKFKNYPFSEVLHEIIKPTVLAKCEEQIEFYLLPKHLKPFGHYPKVVKKEYEYQFQIRIGKIEGDGSSLITDYLPPGIKIKFDSSPCNLPYYRSLPPPNEVTQPIICTNLLTLDNMVKNMLFIKWIPDQKNYVLTLNLVRMLTVTNLIRRLRVKAGMDSKKNKEETKNYIIKMMADLNLDLAAGKSANCFCLFCPLSKTRMEIPVKSIHCDHLQCFDAIMFLLMNERKPSWKCPICNIPCLYDDLEIQYYFMEILLSGTLSDDCRYIVFKSDGTWIPYEENEMEEEPMNLDDDECIIIELE